MYKRNTSLDRAENSVAIAPFQLHANEEPVLDLSSLFAVVEAVRCYPHSLGKRLCQAVADLTAQHASLSFHLSSSSSPKLNEIGSIHYSVQYEGYVYGTLCVACDKKTKLAYLSTLEAEQLTRTCGIVIDAVEKEVFVQFQARRSMCSGFEALTVREREVLMHMGQGHSQRDIARLLQISPTTVATYRQHIYAKWGVNRPLSAVLTGHEAGLFLYLAKIT